MLDTPEARLREAAGRVLEVGHIRPFADAARDDLASAIAEYDLAAQPTREGLTPAPWPDCEVCRYRHVLEDHRSGLAAQPERKGIDMPQCVLDHDHNHDEGDCRTAAQPEREGLVVERLAEAVEAVDAKYPDLESGIVGLKWEKAVAAEYDRLGAEESD